MKPVILQSLYRCYAVVLTLPLHLLVLLAIADTPAAAGGAAAGVAWPPALDLGFLAGQAVTGVIAIAAYLSRGRAATALGVLSAVVLLPRYIWLFPLNWSLSLTGIVICLAIGRYLLRPRTDEDTVAGQGATTGPGAGEFEHLDLFLFACAATALAVMVVCGYGLAVSPPGVAAAWLVVLLSIGLSLSVELRRVPPSWRGGPYAEHVILVLAVLGAAVPAAVPLVLPLLALRQIVAGVRVGLRERGGRDLWNYLLNRPAQLLVHSFALVITLGTVMLTLPGATVAGTLPVVDALFTATSAVCVTGLTVVDTGTTFTAIGQVIILTLIQVGGLGIMTISTFIALVLGQNIGLKSEFAVQEMVGERRSRNALRLITFIIGSTLVIEAVGAVLVTWDSWRGGCAFERAAYLGVFHSISAFCNAGFSVFPRSMEGVGVLSLMVMSLLIILGGLGFSVHLALLNRWFRKEALGMHAKLVVRVTLLLLLGGTLLVWVCERHGALGGVSVGEGWVHAWFMSVTARTAGYNSINMLSLSPPAILIVMALMFVGAAPGSTGGGIKVTAAGVLGMTTGAVFMGRDHVIFAGRKLGTRTVFNAVAVTVLSLLSIGMVTGLLLVTEDQSPGVLLFEAVSAFGTVGLSLGATAKLTTVGKLSIVFLMFIGRVGTLTLLIMLRPKMYRSRFDYPLADVMIG